MSKFNIVITESDSIDGYKNITIDQLHNIINGTCEEIICSVLDKYEYKERLSYIMMMCKKLKNEGSLTLKCINATRLCKNVSSGNMNTQSLSEIISKINSLFLDSDVIELVSQIEGIFIHKMYNDNLYLVSVLKKQL